MTKQAKPRRVVFIVFDGMQALDLVGPWEVFAAANGLAGRTVYALEARGPGEQATADSGLRLSIRSIAGVRGALDTMIVVGGPSTRPTLLDPGLVRHVARIAQHASRIASVCTGSFVLAEAGVLAGRRVATHWAVAGAMRRRYPGLDVDGESIWVQDGPVWTSAGVTAGIDLALAMVAEDLDAALAMEVARWLVLPGRRLGLQSQYSPRLAAERSSAAEFSGLADWMSANAAGDLSVATLASRALMSERNFSRRFTAATGVTPARFVEDLRLDLARDRLTSTTASVDAVARACGFGRRETLHRAFLRRFGLSPGDYRRTFAVNG